MKNSVRDIRKPGGKNAKWDIDPDLASIEWDQNTDATKRFNVKKPAAGVPAIEDAAHGSEIPEGYERLPGGKLTLKDAKVFDLEYSARLRQLKFEQESGRLVDAVAIKDEWVKLITEAKTKLLALPVKAKANLPHLSPGDVSVIDRLLREILIDIADAGP